MFWYIITEIPNKIPMHIPTIQQGWWLRTDARSTPPSIGGWFCRDPQPDSMKVAWFQWNIRTDIFKEICGDIDIERRISALELLAIAVAIRNWAPIFKNLKIQFQLSSALSLETDSMVCKNALHNWKAKTEPMISILREIVRDTVKDNIRLNAIHLPGEKNEWADGLSRLIPEIMKLFSPDNKVSKNNPNNQEFWKIRGKVPWKKHL